MIAPGQMILAADLLLEHNADGSHKAAVGAPTGSIIGFGGVTPPSGWLLCDGAEVARATYAALFAVIGTAYGAGDGSTTFNVPDLRGRVPVGQGAHPDVDALGDSDGLPNAQRTPKLGGATDTQGDHSHTILEGDLIPDRAGAWADIAIVSGAFRHAPGGGDQSFPLARAATNSGGAHAHTIGAQSSIGFLTINYIIKT